MKAWVVRIMPEAKKHMAEIKDRGMQQSLTKALQRLQQEPDKRGKPLHDELLGFRSLRAVGERYRIIYKVIEETYEVHVVTVGIRKEGSRIDAYEVAQRLLKAGRI